VDAQTTSGLWAHMCREHFLEHGVPFSEGLGTVLLPAPFVDWSAEERAAAGIDKQVDGSFLDGAVDVLLTHAGPLTWETSWGSEMLSDLGERLRPRVHLFGHHHEVVGPQEGPGGSLLVGLDHLEFHRGALREGCWGILELAGEGARFTWGHTFPFHADVARESYRALFAL
jgi:hypothetical protein